MAVIVSVSLCLLGILALGTQCVTEETPVTTTVAPANVTTDGGIVISGLTADGSDLDSGNSGNRLTDLDKIGHRRKERNRRKEQNRIRKERKGKKHKKRRQRKERNRIRKEQKGKKDKKGGRDRKQREGHKQQSVNAELEAPKIKELVPSRMRYQECVKWKPDVNITLNLTEKTLFVDYCDPYVPKYPGTFMCLIGEHSQELCEIVELPSCSLIFKELTNDNYTVLIRPMCDTCTTAQYLRIPCSSPNYEYHGFIMRDPDPLFQPSKEGQTKRTYILEIAIGVAGGVIAFTVVIIIAIYYCRRIRKSMSSRNSCSSSDGSPGDAQQFRNSHLEMQPSEPHQYTYLLPPRGEDHQARPKTMAGGSQSPTLFQNSSTNYHMSPCSSATYVKETETSFTVQDRYAASPLLQNCSEVSHEESEEAQDEDSVHTLPFSPARSSGRLTSAQSLGSVVTIDHHDWSCDPSQVRAAPPQVTQSRESLSSATLGECIRRDDRHPGITTCVVNRPNNFHTLIPINYGLIMNEERQNQVQDGTRQAVIEANGQTSRQNQEQEGARQAVMETSEQTSEVTMLTHDMVQPTLDS